MNSIGYPAHGRGPLAPDEPTVICSTCHGAYWYESDLNEDGECQDCAIRSQDDCQDCVSQSEPDEPGMDYPMDIFTRPPQGGVVRIITPR